MSDRAREGLFSSLGEAVAGARCLDLFAGSGALGIEALSRGGAHCTFVDKNRSATTAIRENLRRTHLGDRADVNTRDVVSYLREGASADATTDLVFVDPPYEVTGEALERVLRTLEPSWLAVEDWTVVVTRGQKALLPAVPLDWATRRQLRYGDSLVIVYRPRSFQEVGQEVGWA